MRLGLNLGYSGSSLGIDLTMVQEADRLGYHSVWSAEAYGSDAVTPITWVAAHTSRIKVGTAIMQIPARTPTLTATTALTLDQLSGGRFLLGLGVSGPQVVEGWHGVAFGKPLARTREYVEIVRAVWRREKALEFTGTYYQIPYAGADATGLGKPLRSILHGRDDIPVYLAAIGPKNVALAAEIADGWLPVFFSPERIGRLLRRARADRELDDRASEAERGDGGLHALHGGLQSTSSAIARTAPTSVIPQISVVTPERVQRDSRSAIRSRGPHSATSSTSASGTAAAASCFLPDRYRFWIATAASS